MTALGGPKTQNPKVLLLVVEPGATGQAAQENGVHGKLRGAVHGPCCLCEMCNTPLGSDPLVELESTWLSIKEDPKTTQAQPNAGANAPSDGCGLVFELTSDHRIVGWVVGKPLSRNGGNELALLRQSKIKFNDLR